MYFLAILLSVPGLCGCSGIGSLEDQPPTRVPLPAVPAKPTYDVQQGEVVAGFEFRGRIVPVIEEELSFDASGYVGAIHAARDEMVEDGDLLAELEASDLRNQLAQARTDLETVRLQADQHLVEAQTGLNVVELRLAQENADDPHPQVVIAEIAVRRAELSLTDAQAAYDEAVQDHGAGSAAAEGSAKVLLAAELDLDEAQARYREAYLAHHYAAQILEQEVALARQRLQAIESGLDVQGAELTVKRLEDRLASTQIFAPFAGQVVSVRLSVGRAVEAYADVIVLADPNELEVKADLIGAQANRLSKGMAATIALTAPRSEEVQGYIRRVPYDTSSSGLSGADGSVRVTLDRAAPGAPFHISDIVRVTVELERREDVFWLPPQALRSFEGRDFVVVLQEDGTQRRVDVEIGLQSETRVEIKEGLTAGQVVVGQ
jgi:RND family efflux transporter MFP subunit